jgi:uncharacterized cofD-like protein
VALGGGHGLAVTLRAVLPWAGSVTAVVSTADDGGSTGRLRQDWDVPGLGDVRRCLATLASVSDPSGVWARVLERRFDAGELDGHAMGNLVLLALLEEVGDLQSACDEVARATGIPRSRARVVPVTDEVVSLHGRTADGRMVDGQVAVGDTEGIEEVWVSPACTVASHLALDAITRADLVLLGPGSLYTSVLAAAVVGDVRRALADTEGQVVYLGNLRADGAEARGYDLADHVAALARHGIEPDLALVAAGGLPLGDLGLATVVADGARDDRSGHDPDRLGAALATLVG